MTDSCTTFWVVMDIYYYSTSEILKFGLFMSQTQSSRLTVQQKAGHGVISIFGADAKLHDTTVGKIQKAVYEQLKVDYPQLTFRYRTSITKKEINDALQKVDPTLGQTLFVEKASIIPDGGVIEVLDDNEKWRVVLVSEAKVQGKDVENIRQGKLVGKNDNQDLMAACKPLAEYSWLVAEIRKNNKP